MATVETLTGPVEVADLGPTLMHEHVFTLDPDYLANYGAGDWWDEDVECERAVDKLNRLAAKGITTIVDPTVLGLGRDIRRLQRIADRIDLNVIVATGVYTYDSLPFPYSLQGPGLPLGGEDPLARDFTRDLTVGIADTGVRAAFLKCAVEHVPMSDDVERALRSVARVSVATGAPITVHTNVRERTADTVLEVLADERVDPQRVVLGHVGDSTDVDWLATLADHGAILGMDRFGLDVFAPTDARVATIVELARRGYADRMVLSHDASCRIDWFGEESPEVAAALMPNWHYEHISDDVLDALRRGGVTDDQIDAMLTDVPRRFFGG